MPKLPRMTVMFLAHQTGKTHRMSNIMLSIFVVSLVGLFGVGFWSAGTTYYQYENRQLQNRLREVEFLSDQYQARLDSIIQAEQNSRIIVGLLAIHPDTRQVGVGGVFYDPMLERPHSPVARSVQLQETFDKLIREARLSLASLEEIEQKAEETQTYWNHVPTVRPVNGVTTSQFGMRNDPFTGLRRMHNGVDIAARRGSPVHAPADGVVSRTGLNADLGLYVEINHQNGLITRYGHLSSIDVASGKEVSRRHVIGKVGKTGRANGYHLHYEVRRYGNGINPKQYFWPEEMVVN